MAILRQRGPTRHSGNDTAFDDAAMLVNITAGKLGGQPGGGVIAFGDFGLGGMPEAYFAWDCTFSPQFPFARQAGVMQALGGKLHGFHNNITGLPWSPTNRPNGANGFSARLMFMGDQGSGDGMGRASLYVHDMLSTGYGRSPKLNGRTRNGSGPSSASW